MPHRVIIESPFAGKTDEEKQANIDYARKACMHAITQGYVPFASHLFFTQFLDDNNPDQRALGIEMGYDFWDKADIICFYIDRGMSPGMKEALTRAFLQGKTVKKFRLSTGTEIDMIDTPMQRTQDYAPKKPIPVDLDQLKQHLEQPQNAKG